jgi:hypothetical protein
MVYFTPESPRFHSLHGDNAAAYDVLHKFASATTCRGGDAMLRLAATCPTADSLLRLTKRAPSIKEAAMAFFSRSHLLLNFTLVVVWISMNFGWLLSLAAAAPFAPPAFALPLNPLHRYGLSIWMPSYFQAYAPTPPLSPACSSTAL